MFLALVVLVAKSDTIVGKPPDKVTPALYGLRVVMSLPVVNGNNVAKVMSFAPRGLLSPLILLQEAGIGRDTAVPL